VSFPVYSRILSLFELKLPEQQKSPFLYLTLAAVIFQVLSLACQSWQAGWAPSEEGPLYRVQRCELRSGMPCVGSFKVLQDYTNL